MAIRAALYAHAYCESLNDQIRMIANYAAEQDILIVRVYGELGSSPGRGLPDFERLCKDARLGAFAAVLATDAGRIGSNRYEAARFRWRLRSVGVRLLYTEAADTVVDKDDDAWEGLIEYYEVLMEQMTRKGDAGSSPVT